MDWVEIIVPVGAADVDDVAALIAQDVSAAAAGTEQRGDEVVFWVARAEVGSAMAEIRDVATAWQANGLAIDPARVRTAEAMPEAEWRDAWKKYFKVSRLTRQFVVVPSWEPYAAQPGDVTIDLDPGMAFGTGTHASTRLVLEEMQRLADGGLAPAKVLDVGCGPGILAIAAAKLWGCPVIAVDNDPIAIAATDENAATNKVTSIAASLTPCGDVAGSFPLVLANIQAHVLRLLMTDLIARTDGTLILSGLLTPQAAPLADEFVAAGMTLVAIRPSSDDPQWSSVTLSK